MEIGSEDTRALELDIIEILCTEREARANVLNWGLRATLKQICVFRKWVSGHRVDILGGRVANGLELSPSHKALKENPSN